MDFLTIRVQNLGNNEIDSLKKMKQIKEKSWITFKNKL